MVEISTTGGSTWLDAGDRLVTERYTDWLMTGPDNSILRPGFTAGTLGMSYPRFIATDAAGAAIMTPIFVYLGYASGEKIAELKGTVENLHQILGFVILGLLIAFSVHIYFGQRGSRRTQPEGDVSSGAPSQAPAPRDDVVDGDRP